MYGSPAASKDLELSFAYNSLHRQRKEEMSSSSTQQGLLRYRSAPSSLLGEVCDDFLPAAAPRPPSSPDAAETMLAHFLSSNSQFPPPQPPPPQASRTEESRSMFYHHQQHQQHQQQQQQIQTQVNHSHSVAVETAAASAGCPSLVRHSSSPAGLFAHLNVENGYGLMRSMSGVRNGSVEVAGGTASASASAATGRLKSQLSYSSRQGSIMSQISEMRSDGMGGSSPEESSGGGGRCYIPGYPIGSWDDSQVLADNFSGLKRAREPGPNQSDLQNGEIGNNSAGLMHQFILPKTSSDIAAMEKFLQFQDAVPCKVRAKRGCATHPRSIAERVRRTRISERMRKLQELVPNMDKQTNTADMLDMAVDYIKELQKQVKTLSDNRANCTCSSENQNLYHQPA